MFIAALFVIAQILKQLKCPSTSQQINKKGYIPVMEHSSAIQRDELLITTDKRDESENNNAE